MIDGLGTDSIWYRMMVDRTEELVRDERLTVEQIAQRTGLSVGAVNKARKRWKDAQKRGNRT